MRRIGIGKQSFRRIIQNDLFYVDKTKFIYEWYMDESDVTLITRPRRFGKTLNLDMVDTFFNIGADKALFNGLEIAQYPEMMNLQGTVPVIFLSFSTLKNRTFTELLGQFSVIIANLIGKFNHLLDGRTLSKSDRELFIWLSNRAHYIPDVQKNPMEYDAFILRQINSVNWLSSWLRAFYGKDVFILLDEYDTPILEAYQRGYYSDAVQFIRSFFQATFKNNDCMEKALQTGITRIAKESLFSDMNNVWPCSMLSGGYDSFFGFTDTEIEEILTEYHLSNRKQEIQFWYDGYTIGKETSIYNPWSISAFLKRSGEPLEPYWANTGGTGLIDYLIRFGEAGLLVDFQRLLGGNEIECDVRDEINPELAGDNASVWGLLVAAGYLKMVRHENGKNGYMRPIMRFSYPSAEWSEYGFNSIHGIWTMNLRRHCCRGI